MANWHANNTLAATEGQLKSVSSGLLLYTVSVCRACDVMTELELHDDVINGVKMVDHSHYF